MPGFLSGRMIPPEARSPSGKAKVCKTFIGGSIPPRASNFPSGRSRLSLQFLWAFPPAYVLHHAAIVPQLREDAIGVDFK